MLVANGVLGWFHERGAERALASLRRLGARRATVRRGGEAAVVDAAHLVPGDVVLLEAGDLVPADVRLLRAESFQTVEAALTGESSFVEKDADAGVANDAPLPERPTMAYSGTTVASGVAHAVVVATGPATELGHVAALVGGVRREPTPLQRELARLNRRLVLAALLAIAGIFVLGLLRGHRLSEMFPAAVGLAVAAVPESLPAVVTIALAVGVRRMARRHVLLRRLPAVETLGSTTVVCVDKTGTLTTGRMEVRVVATRDEVLPLDRPLEDASSPAALALRAAACCTTATVVERDGGGAEVRGDPMEGAILLAARRAGIPPCEGDPERTLPFDARRKRMSVVRAEEGGLVLYVKGAPESVVPGCGSVRGKDGAAPADDAARERLAERNAEMADEGLRVLAAASRRLDAPPDDESPDALDRDLEFLGFLGFQDPPRDDTRRSVAACRGAGIRPVMITGDQAGTALAIARALGIASSREEVVSGAEVAAMGDDELARRVGSIAVYARTSPAEKLRIVRALRAQGEVVAMTGDGVNDAPALKGADIGVAMGSGTDAAKDVAAMVVTDDRFSSIVEAVAEGRTVHENVRKSLLYVLSGNVGETLAVSGALFAGWPIPLLPVQILWVNLVTDSLPALSLATDPRERGVLDRPPRPQGRGLADKKFLAQVLETGVLVGAVTLLAFAIGQATGSVERARSMAFSTLVVGEVLRSFVVRSRTRTIWEVGLASNVRLLVVGLGTLALQAAILFVPAVGRVLGVSPLPFADLVVVGALGLVPATVVEVAKLVRRALRRRRRR